MRLLFTSDLHGIIPAYERFAELLGSESYDAGVLAGDLLEEVLTDEQIVALTGIDPDQLLDELPGDDEAAFTDWENRPWNRYLDLALDARVRQIEGILHGSGKSVFFVLGNHDHRIWPGTPLVRDLHLRRIELDGQAFVGYRWANGQRKGEEFEADIAALHPLVDSSTILVSHAPPFGILDSTRNLDPRTRRASQIGLRQLNGLKPRFHLFGHVHEAAGRKGGYVNGCWIELRKFFDIDIARRRVRMVE